MFLPQGLCTGCSLFLKHFSFTFLTFLKYLIQCHYLNKSCPNYPIKNFKLLHHWLYLPPRFHIFFSIVSIPSNMFFRTYLFYWLLSIIFPSRTINSIWPNSGIQSQYSEIEGIFYTNNEISETEIRKISNLLSNKKNKVPRNKPNQGGKRSILRKLHNTEERN